MVKERERLALPRKNKLVLHSRQWTRHHLVALSEASNYDKLSALAGSSSNRSTAMIGPQNWELGFGHYL